MIEPTVGRQVWYYRDDSSSSRGPLAATVTYVHGDRLVNLSVLSEKGSQFPEINVKLLQDDDPIPTKPYCCWMPYQKGQAAKTEQAEAVAKAARSGFGGGNRP